MKQSVMIVPGIGSSGPDHWQSWLEHQLPCAYRLTDVDWNKPILAEWSRCLKRQLKMIEGKVWLVAHSFGCLVSTVIAADIPEKIAGVLLVAPADPDRFHLLGRHCTDTDLSSLKSIFINLSIRLTVPSLMIASTNDPWMTEDRAHFWAKQWNTPVKILKAAGHINPDYGFGSWPEGQTILRSLMHNSEILSEQSHTSAINKAGWGGLIAKVRAETRKQLGI